MAENKEEKENVKKCKCDCDSHNKKCENDGKKCVKTHEEKTSCSCSCGHREHSVASCGCEDEEKIGGAKVFLYIIGALLLTLAFLGELGFVKTWASIVCSAVVYLFFGKETFVGAYKAIRNKRFFTEFTLMSIASLGAVCLGEFADAAAVLYLYSLGEMISGAAYRKSKDNISELLELTSDKVTVVKDKKAVTVSADKVNVGDVISVRVGDKISLDGVVVSGNGFADTSSVTGETLPAELSKGSVCYAGSSLLSGALFIKVTETYDNSTASKLKRAVDIALKQKAKREKRITRFAEIFTPIAFGVAALVFLVCSIVSGKVADGLRPALVVLVASCPCSLVLSVPLAYFSGIGRAAHRGIVFRSGQTIDSVAKIETVVFDKTGTLTSSTPEFVGVKIPSNATMSKVQILDYAKAALLKSPHVLARVFCEKYTESVTYQADGAKNIGGRGLVCLIGGKKAAFGNKKLMDEIGTKVPDCGKSAIYISVDREYCGALLFEAAIKENALAQISALRGNGVKRIAIMSGDTESTVREVADVIGVSEFYYELKPDEKLSRFNNIYKEEKRSKRSASVAFCGDGLNDSAVISRADVGIAMGSGSALTVENADVVIVDDNLERINDALFSAKKTTRVVVENIVISLGVKLAVILLGLAGHPSIELAVVADVGAALVTVLNSMRAGRLGR